MSNCLVCYIDTKNKIEQCGHNVCEVCLGKLYDSKFKYACPLKCNKRDTYKTITIEDNEYIEYIEIIINKIDEIIKQTKWSDTLHWRILENGFQEDYEFSGEYNWYIFSAHLKITFTPYHVRMINDCALTKRYLVWLFC